MSCGHVPHCGFLHLMFLAGKVWWINDGFDCIGKSVLMLLSSLALTSICERLGECLYETVGGCLNICLRSSLEVSLGQSSSRCSLMDIDGSNVVTKVNGCDVLLRLKLRYRSRSLNGMMGEFVMYLGYFLLLN